MTPEQLREAAAVMLAAADGKAIQRRYLLGAEMSWEMFDPLNLIWSWYKYEYRIKPEPRKIKVAIYVNPADGYHLPIMECDIPRFNGWKRVSDIVEIEVRDE